MNGSTGICEFISTLEVVYLSSYSCDLSVEILYSFISILIVLA